MVNPLTQVYCVHLNSLSKTIRSIIYFNRLMTMLAFSSIFGTSDSVEVRGRGGGGKEQIYFYNYLFVVNNDRL